MQKTVVWFILSILITITSYAKDLKKVEVYEVKALPKESASFYTTRVESEKIVEQLAPFSGEVVAQYVKFGDKVKKGNQILALKRTSLGQQYGQLIVRANIDGVINEVYHLKGTEFSAGKPLFQIVDVDNLKIEILVSDKDAIKLSLNQKVVIQKKKDVKLSGVIEYLSQIPDPSNGLFKVRIKPDGNDKNLKIGSFVLIMLNEDQQDLFQIPKTSLINESNKPYVLALDKDNKIYKKNVSIKTTEKDTYVVILDFVPREKIIKKASDQLKEGETVEVIESSKKSGRRRR